MAMHVAFGNLGGIIAAYIYRASDGPRFTSGHGALIGFQCMSLALSIFMTFWLRRENARRFAVSGKTSGEYTEAEKLAEREKGDWASFFRYTV
jgi:ABC-type Fe3+ transport system permease subunit